MTRSRSRSLSVCAVLCAIAAATPAAQKPQLPDLLKKTSDYLVGYSKALTGINAEEDYTQRDVTVSVSGDYRHLKSDMTFIGLGDGTIASFRDVFEADGKSTREHGPSRLGTLLVTPTQAAVNSAQELTGASTRHAAARLTARLLSMPQDNRQADLRRQLQEDERRGRRRTYLCGIARPAAGRGVPPILQLPNGATAGDTYR